MDKFSHFMSQIPDSIMQAVERHLCNDIALFRPQSYIAGRTMHAVDFHIIVPSVTPPDTYINNELKSFDSGKILAINPGDTIFCAEARPTKQYLSLLIKPELINKVAEEMDVSGDIRFIKFQNPFSSDLIQAINSFDKEVRRPDKLNLMMDCLGIQIVALLLREFKTNVKKYPACSPDSDTYIALAMEYMQEFFSANITIEDICSEINISPFHFIRSFKKKTGMSPHQYLMNVRIKKAEELLRMSQYSVREASIMCGFINLSHFSSTFKGITGNSPRDYKKLFS